MSISRHVPPPSERHAQELRRWPVARIARQPGGPPGMPMKLALVAIKKWPNGAKVRCRFLEGDRAVRVKVERLAHLWERYANVTFQFVTTGAGASADRVHGGSRIVVGARH